MTHAPIIVTATFGDGDFALLNGLRQQHFPPALNRVPAHLTLFHHLPPSEGRSIAERLKSETRGVPAPSARLAAVRHLGRGVAFDVESPALQDIRWRLADAFADVLIPQDRAAWRPHVTIQNKVEPEVARDLAEKLKRDFRPRPVRLSGLASWLYRDGLWEALGRYPFA